MSYYDCEAIRDSVVKPTSDDFDSNSCDEQDILSSVNVDDDISQCSTEKCSPDQEYRDGLGEIKGCYDVIENDNSTSSRRVSFPKSDKELVTGYLEPANPWECVAIVKNTSELRELYLESCKKHNTHPLQPVLEHLQLLELNKAKRHPCLNLKDNLLTPESCEALEEILKRVQYQTIDLTACDLNDMAATALFDMIEYYEAANDLDISGNPSISSRGWQSCISMIRRSRALQTLTVRGIALSELNAASLGKSLNQSCLHTIKLEHCGLTGRPLFSLCNALRKNTALRELWLAYNDLSDIDAERIGHLLRANAYLQFLDISNNKILDVGVKHLVGALIEQSTNMFQQPKSSDTTFSNGALSLYPASTYKNLIDFTELNQCVDNNTKTEIFDSDRTEGITNPTLKYSTPGRSMLDTLLTMNTKNTEEIRNETNLIQCIGNNNDNIMKNLDITDSFDGDSHTIDTDSGVSITCSSIDTPTSNLCPNIDITIENAEKICQKDNKLLEKTANNNIVLNDNIKNDTIEDDVFTNTDLKAFDENKNTKIDDTNINQNPNQLTENLIEITNENLSFEIDSDSSNKTKPLDYSNIIDGNEKSPEIRARSLSSDSLNSDTSVDMSDSNLSVKINEKLTKNDTLGRQKPNIETQEYYKPPPRGLQAIILWNNNVTRESAEYIADLLAITNSLELLNIGKNILSNDFIEKIKEDLKKNSSLTNLGLQSAHLTCSGIKTLANVVQFGGNSTLQRIDIRDNNVQVEGLSALGESLKSNKSVTRIDIDDVPKRAPANGHESLFHYSRALHTIRTLCSKNESPHDTTTTPCNNLRRISQFPSSRKISLTCQSIRTPLPDTTLRTDNAFDSKKKSGTRLRSPLPSPPTASPSSSPVPSPSRSRFQVFRVVENKPTDTLNIPRKESPPKKMCTSPGSRFRVTIVENPITSSSNDNSSLDKSNISINTGICQTKPPVSDAIEIKQSTNNININSNKQNEKSLPILNESGTDLDHSRFTDESFSSTSSIDSFDSNQESKTITSFNSSDSNDINIDNKDISIDSLNELQTFYSQNIIPEIAKTQSCTVLDSPIRNSPKTIDDDNNTLVDESSRKSEPETRVRKVSWISGSNCPTVDKLISLFHPSNLFSRSVSPDNEKKNDNNDIIISSSQSLVPIRKETPPSLFAAWHKTNQQSDKVQQHISKSLTQTDNVGSIGSSTISTSSSSSTSSTTSSSFFDAATKQIRGFADFGKQVFKQNVPFGDNPNPSSSILDQCDTIPKDVKLEIKENISPDHTITANTITTLQAVQSYQQIFSHQTTTTTTTAATTTITASIINDSKKDNFEDIEINKDDDTNLETKNSFDTSFNNHPDNSVLLASSGLSGESL